MFPNLQISPCTVVGHWCATPVPPRSSDRSSCLLWLTEAALSVNAGGSSKQEQRRREDGSAPQVEASSKLREADPVRRGCRAAASQQSPLHSRRSPRRAT